MRSRISYLKRGRPTTRQLAAYTGEPVIPPVEEVIWIAGPGKRRRVFKDTEFVLLNEFLLCRHFRNYRKVVVRCAEHGWRNCEAHVEDLFGDPAIVLESGHVVFRAKPKPLAS